MIDDYGIPEGSSIAGGFGLLLILFIALKIFGLIAWPWIWVFAPMWIPIILVVLFLLWNGIRGE